MSAKIVRREFNMFLFHHSTGGSGIRGMCRGTHSPVTPKKTKKNFQTHTNSLELSMYECRKPESLRRIPLL